MTSARLHFPSETCGSRVQTSDSEEKGAQPVSAAHVTLTFDLCLTESRHPIPGQLAPPTGPQGRPQAKPARDRWFPGRGLRSDLSGKGSKLTYSTPRRAKPSLAEFLETCESIQGSPASLPHPAEHICPGPPLPAAPLKRDQLATVLSSHRQPVNHCPPAALASCRPRPRPVSLLQKVMTPSTPFTESPLNSPHPAAWVRPVPCTLQLRRWGSRNPRTGSRGPGIHSTRRSPRKQATRALF